NDAVTAISAGIADLANPANEGLSDFIVPGYPDLGQIPLNAPDPTDPVSLAISAGATGASVLFNTVLQVELAALSASLTDVSITYVDIFGAFTDIAADPLAVGITEDLFDTCLGGVIPVGSVAASTIDCTGFLFWDDIHPTESIHTVVAELIRPELAPVPLPASVWMLIAAFGGLAYAGRRRAAVTG
ncbi:MAG: VPLPA-CTERM sorting domain-containing protein, partial [Pseudomonadota bacterium]